MLTKNFNIDYNPIRTDAENDLVQMYTFSSDRKRMSAVVRFEEENQYRIFTKGAAEVVFGICNRIMDHDGSTVDITDDIRDSIEKEINGMAKRGLRPLLLAFNDFEVKGILLLVFNANL